MNPDNIEHAMLTQMWPTTIFSLIAYRRLNKDWLWEEFVKLAIKEKGLIGEDADKFKKEPDHHYLKSVAVNLLPDCNSDNYTNLSLGHPPPKRGPQYIYKSKPRAKKAKKEPKKVCKNTR